MGRNSKARRDAKRKAERWPTGRPAGAPPTALGHQLADVDDTAMNRVMRSSCNECGSTNLSWMTIGELHDQVPDGIKPRTQEGVEMVGADGHAWSCGDCGNFGIMGPVHGSF